MQSAWDQRLALSVLGPKLLTSYMLINYPGGLEQQESISVVTSVLAAARPLCAILVPGSAWDPKVGPFSLFVAATGSLCSVVVYF